MMYTEKSDGSDMNYTSTNRDRYCEVVDRENWSCLDHRFSELISRGLVELPKYLSRVPLPHKRPFSVNFGQQLHGTLPPSTFRFEYFGTLTHTLRSTSQLSEPARSVMSEKKRKRDSQVKQRPRKKLATAGSTASDTVKLTVIQDVDEWTPLLGKYVST